MTPKFTAPDIAAVAIEDDCFAPRIRTNRETTIPWSLKACEDTGRIDAFRLTWKPGLPNEPHVFWDSDVAKVLEGCALDLRLHPDPALASALQRVVDLIVSAQQPDGYLNTHFTVVEPEKRFTNLFSDHELYCTGHLIEAAVAHYEATGRREFLDCMCRCADLIATVFGRGKNRKRGYPGHEEIELALVKLARCTGKAKYLRLAKYFIDERGREPNYFAEVEPSAVPSRRGNLSAFQAHKPVREQKEAIGHAVRAAYLYAGMADVALETDDEGLLDVCERLFDDIARHKMYITGGIGSTPNGEAIENAYKLPPLLAYAESCAAIALALFARRMHNATGAAKYLDVLERALYNGIPAGISLSGDKFFYKNPLRMSVDSPYEKIRQSWFHCSCCPTNFCRFFPQIGSFVWSESEDGVRLNIPVASTFRSNGRALRVTGGYPYDGDIRIEVLEDATAFTLSIRFPGWCNEGSVSLNGKRADPTISEGFLSVRRTWRKGDVVDLHLEMPVSVLRANPAVDDCAGKIALQRGPIVYALESIDNGPLLQTLSIPAKQPFALKKANGLPTGTIAIAGTAFRDAMPKEAADELYTEAKPRPRKCRFTAIPYALWQNRGPSEMAVWIREAR